MGAPARASSDPTFYRSPAEAVAAPAEKLAYVVAFDRTAQRPDALTVVDVDPGSARYGQVVGWADLGGGRTLPGVSRPNIGRELVAERVMQFFGAASGNRLAAHTINGEPSVVAFVDGSVASVLALSVTDHLISRVYVVSDPRKLAHVKRVLDRKL